MTQQQKKIARVFISFSLEGEEAAKFLAYKKDEFIKNNAEAGRKLMLERLYQRDEVRAGQTKRTAAE